MSPPQRDTATEPEAPAGRPRLLFVNQHYWPDVAATAQQLTDLAEHLASEGFDVTVLCSRGHYTAGQMAAPARETRHGVRIVRLRTTAFGRGRHAGRLTDYATFYAQVAARLAAGPRFDLVVALTTPPLIGAAAALARSIRGQRFAIWSMDLHPDAEFALGMLSPAGLPGRALAAIDGWSYRAAEFVIDLGPCMRARLLEKGVDASRVRTIPVWSRADEVAPVEPCRNPLRAELGLDDRFVVMYSGNAGLAHRFDEVLDAMARLRDRRDVEFVFAGSGPRRREIEAFISEHRISNARYLDYFPRERLRYSLPLGDLHLITLREDMSGIAVPNKLFGIMAAGRPAVMVGPTTAGPARIIENERIGLVIPPADGAGARLAAAITAYAEDRQRGHVEGQRARAALLARYDREVACAAWARVLRSYLAPTPAGAAALVPAVG